MSLIKRIRDKYGSREKDLPKDVARTLEYLQLWASGKYTEEQLACALDPKWDGLFPPQVDLFQEIPLETQ